MATTAAKKTSSSSQTMTKTAAKKTAKATGTGKNKTLEQLLEEGLQDIYSAEQQLIEALPEMAKAAYDEELENAFNQHLEQTKKQAQRLEKVCSRLNITPGGKDASTIADAFASADSALTFKASMWRSRSTLDRLASASDKFPPACC